MTIPPELLVPAESRLPADHPHYDLIVARHLQAVREGQSLYPDPVTGLWAMTALGLWERGSCCESGCRHCPWAER